MLPMGAGAAGFFVVAALGVLAQAAARFEIKVAGFQLGCPPEFRGERPVFPTSNTTFLRQTRGLMPDFFAAMDQIPAQPLRARVVMMIAAHLAVPVRRHAETAGVEVVNLAGVLLLGGGEELGRERPVFPALFAATAGMFWFVPQDLIAVRAQFSFVLAGFFLGPGFYPGGDLGAVIRVVEFGKGVGNSGGPRAVYAQGFQGAADPRDGDPEFFSDDVHRDVLAVTAQELGGFLAGFSRDGKAAQMGQTRPFGILRLGKVHPANLLGNGIHRAEAVAVGREGALTMDRQRTVSGPDEFREPLFVFRCPT